MDYPAHVSINESRWTKYYTRSQPKGRKSYPSVVSTTPLYSCQVLTNPHTEDMGPAIWLHVCPPRWIRVAQPLSYFTNVYISPWSLMNSSTWWNLCLPLVKPKHSYRYGNECDEFRTARFLTASISQNTLSNKSSVWKYNESDLKESLPFLHNNVV